MHFLNGFTFLKCIVFVLSCEHVHLVPFDLNHYFMSCPQSFPDLFSRFTCSDFVAFIMSYSIDEQLICFVSLFNHIAINFIVFPSCTRKIYGNLVFLEFLNGYMCPSKMMSHSSLSSTIMKSCI